MKRILLTAAALTALSAGAYAQQAQWSVAPFGPGFVYSTRVTSPSTATQPLYTSTVFTNGKLGGAIAYQSLISYAISATTAGNVATPSVTIITSKDPNPVAASAVSITLVPKTAYTSATNPPILVSDTRVYSENTGAITGMQFVFNHGISDTELVKVYELPNFRP